MSSYSYKPARYGTGQAGKVRHEPARYHTIKLYTQDLKIAKQHLDALKKAQTTVISAPTGRAESAGDWLEDPTRVHNMQADFHHKRAMAYFEAARYHSQNFMNSREASDNEKTPMNGKIPSMYDSHKDGSEHTEENALVFHTQLHGDAMMEAQHYVQLGKSMTEELNAMTSEDPKAGQLREAVDVCKGMYNLYSNIAEMHNMYAGDYKDFLARRADVTFNRDVDNMQTEPPAFLPGPNI